MVNTGSFFFMLVVSVVLIAFTMKVERWWGRLILFIFSIGAVNITLGIASPGNGWTVLANTLLFGAMGILYFRTSGGLNKVFGVVFVIIALALLYPTVVAFNSDGMEAPMSVWEVLEQAWQTGWRTFTGTLDQVFALSR